MSPEAAKAIASLIASVMAFLGWGANDYVKYVPVEIQANSTSSAVVTAPPSRKESKPKKPKIISKQPIVKKISNPKVTAAPSPYEGEGWGEVNPVVNILCSLRTSNTLEQYTGSGVVIDPSGVIITNAHVAEHVLLAESGRESCQIRTGSPAKNAYKAKVIYLPDAWIGSNRNNLSAQSLIGTGENDYAILIITERTAIDAPNVPLLYLSLSEKSAASGDAITLAGYPANFGNASLLDTALYLLQKPSSIKSVFGFSGSGNDVIDTSATPLAERGSSGGAIIDSDGKLLGIMDSVIRDNFSSQNAIQGISISYIKNSIQNNTGKTLNSFIDNAASEAKSFEANKVQYLSSMLTQGL
ncbi:MAG: serine protease [Patescibacteria group bacterium]